jgi:hypothetical protein
MVDSIGNVPPVIPEGAAGVVAAAGLVAPFAGEAFPVVFGEAEFGDPFAAVTCVDGTVVTIRVASEISARRTRISDSWR